MPRWARVKGIITEEEVKKAYSRATDSMAKLNRWDITLSTLSICLQVGGNTDAQIWGPRCN